MQRQHPEQDTATEQAPLKQLRLLGALLVLLGPLMFVIALFGGDDTVEVMGFTLTPPLSTIAICGLGLTVFLAGLALVRAKHS